MLTIYKRDLDTIRGMGCVLEKHGRVQVAAEVGDESVACHRIWKKQYSLMTPSKIMVSSLLVLATTTPKMTPKLTPKLTSKLTPTDRFRQRWKVPAILIDHH